MQTEHIILGKFSHSELDSIISASYQIKEIPERIDFLSRQFIGIDYLESTLIGNKDVPEVFVINLEGMDCFTFLDYIEAMRLSRTYSEFLINLKKVRYKSGQVSFENRNHFFTDWIEFNSDSVDDFTEKIGLQKTVYVYKILNEKEDGSFFLHGIQPIKREIKFIPSSTITDSVIDKLITGDYIGIYSDIKGLDVSHTGIFIKNGDLTFLRHASSLKEYRKVIDQDFLTYIKDKTGIIVLRPR